MAGYTFLADLIGRYPELAVFRRFLALNVKDLLCLQGEIIDQERRLRRTIENDRKAAEGSVRRLFEYDISALKGPHDIPGDSLQWHKQMELHEAVLQFVALCRLAPAEHSNLTALREVLVKLGGGQESFLHAYEFDTWAEEYESDMASLAALPTDKDVCTKLIEKLTRTVYHEHVGSKLQEPMSAGEAWDAEGKHLHMNHYPEKYITTGMNVLTTVISSMTPAIAALILFFIKKPLTRMVVIIASTFIFSLAMLMMARPTRAECFMATAGFAAVLVVFVGGNIGCEC